MALEWIHENPPLWNDDKARIVGGAPAGVFDLTHFKPGDVAPGDWWRVEDDGDVVGFGWMDCTWGDAEILLAVDPGKQRHGVGTFILDRLEQEAGARGLNYLYNEVRSTHPDGERLTEWLTARRFAPSHDERLLKRRVKAAGATGSSST